MTWIVLLLALVAAWAAWLYLGSKVTGKGAILGRNKVFSL